MTIDALEAVGTPELREALLFVRSRPQAVGADELAAAQSVHRNVARRRLDRLVDAGLLVSSYERRSGRVGPGAGRPAKLYSAAPEMAAIEFPPRHYEDLVALLVEALPARSRSPRLHAAGVALAKKLLGRSSPVPVAGLRRGLERLSEALGRLGFHATVESVGDTRAVMTTATCPLRPLVIAASGAGEIDCGLWCGLVAAAVEDVTADEVSCRIERCLDGNASCRILIEIGGPRDASPAR